MNITIKITITTLLYYLDYVARPLVPRAKSPGDVDEAKVCDDRSTVLEEDVLCRQVLPTSNDFAGKSVSCTRTSCIMIIEIMIMIIIIIIMIIIIIIIVIISGHLVNNPLVMQITHALCNLLCDDDHLNQFDQTLALIM